MTTIQECEDVSIPTFYECPNGNCGFLHPFGYNVSCADIENRYDPDSLDDLYGEDGWREVEPVATTKPNLLRLEGLRPDIDLNGNVLEVGCRVRYYRSAHYVVETDTIAGYAMTATSGSAIDGVLEVIGEVDADGIARYTIRAVSEDLPTHDHRFFNQTGKLVVINRVKRMRPNGDYIHPPVNGAPARLCAIPSNLVEGLQIDPKNTCPSFAVFRL
jgi:hypothetical protein